MKGTRIIDKTRARRLRNALIASGLVAATIAGCSSGDERRRAAGLAGGCSINSDCQPDFICAFERCHEACTRDYDCTVPLRCVKSRQTDLFVCQLPDETECGRDADCPRGQGCGIDEECRDVCADSDDCVGNQSCDPSGKCASTEPGRDVLDAQGRLVAAGPLPAPGGGEGGQGSADGASPSAGAPSDGGAPSEGGAPRDAYPPAEYEEQPGLDEAVANDFREDAIPVTKAVNIYLSSKTGAGLEYDQDADWFAFKAPDDGRGHVITVRMQQEASLQLNLKVYAQADGTAIGNQILEKGTLRYAYVTVASGSTTLFSFSNYLVTGSQGMAFITFEDEPEADDHEPNDEKEAAAPITLGDTNVGQALNPFLSESVHPNQDWYALELDVGSATITLDSAPTDARLELDVLYPNQGQPTVLKRPDVGGTGSWNFNVTTAGTHYIVIQPSQVGGTGAIHSFEYLTKPDYLQTQYSFSVTQ